MMYDKKITTRLRTDEEFQNLFGSKSSNESVQGVKKGFKNIYFLLFDRKQYSFSIEVKERKILNEMLLLQELNLNKSNFLKREEENFDINNDLNILNI